jgi:hypothetical protein
MTSYTMRPYLLVEPIWRIKVHVYPIKSEQAVAGLCPPLSASYYSDLSKPEFKCHSSSLFAFKGFAVKAASEFDHAGSSSGFPFGIAHR